MQHTNRHSKRDSVRLTPEERKAAHHKQQLITALKKAYYTEKIGLKVGKWRPDGDRVSKWANDLGDALERTDIAKIEELSAFIKSDREACMKELTEIAGTQCPPRSNVKREKNKVLFVTGDAVLSR